MIYRFEEDSDKKMQLFDELFQLLIESDSAFNYCYQYFIEDVTGWRFEEELRERRENGISDRYFLSRHMASWIPWESSADKLIARIRKMADEE